MTNDKEHFVGIDVSKDKFDVAIYGEKGYREAADNKRELQNW